MKIDQYLPEQFVVAGTDTGVGKTVVSAILAAGLHATYWKPLQSGLSETTDTEMVQRLSALPAGSILTEAYRLTTPISPHASAALDGVRIDPARLRLPEVEGRVIIEGAGGLMVPINNETLLIEVIRQWQLPVLLVARSRLGTINHTLLSLNALRSYGIGVVGVVINGERDEVSRQAIEFYGKVKVLAEVPILTELTPATIKDAYARLFGGDEF
jgi:dethiobiotin synthetase